MKYFNRVYVSIEEIKKHFRTLVMENHPDLGGSEEITKEINIEYQTILKEFVSSTYWNYREQNGNFEYDKEDVNNLSDIISKVIDLDGLRLEIIGTWLYAFNSFAHKDYLKSIGFWFSGKHKAWIFNNAKKVYRHSNHTLEAIKSKYGCTKVTNRNKPNLIEEELCKA